MKIMFLLILIITAVLISGCISNDDITTKEATENINKQNITQLIPREVLFGNPDKTSSGISPDGTLISYLAPLDGVLNVWVGPADDPAAAEPVTNDTDRGIRTYFWAYTNEHILYLQDQAGDENWRIYIGRNQNPAKRLYAIIP